MATTTTSTPTKTAAKRPSPQVIAAEDLAKLQATLGSLGLEEAKFARGFGVKKLSQLPAAQVDAARSRAVLRQRENRATKAYVISAPADRPDLWAPRDVEMTHDPDDLRRIEKFRLALVKRDPFEAPAGAAPAQLLAAAEVYMEDHETPERAAQILKRLQGALGARISSANKVSAMVELIQAACPSSKLQRNLTVRCARNLSADGFKVKEMST